MKPYQLGITGRLVLVLSSDEVVKIVGEYYVTLK